MCWSETPTGVFDSTKAKRIGDELVEWVLSGDDTFRADVREFHTKSDLIAPSIGECKCVGDLQFNDWIDSMRKVKAHLDGGE